MSTTIAPEPAALTLAGDDLLSILGKYLATTADEEIDDDSVAGDLSRVISGRN